MGTHIDHGRVEAMLKNGIPAAHIAHRLKATERQIRRIIKLRGLKRTVPSIAKYLDTPAEYALWKEWYRRNGSYRMVAWMFGVNANTVWFKLELHKLQPSPGGTNGTKA